MLTSMERKRTAIATRSDSQKASMNSGLEKNFSNQRVVTPTGGKEM